MNDTTGLAAEGRRLLAAAEWDRAGVEMDAMRGHIHDTDADLMVWLVEHLPALLDAAEAVEKVRALCDEVDRDARINDPDCCYQKVRTDSIRAVLPPVDGDGGAR